MTTTNDDVTKAADERLEALGALAVALGEAQQSVAPQVRDATLKTSKYGFDYLSAEQTIRVAREALAAHGLALVATGTLDRETFVDASSGKIHDAVTARVRGHVVHRGGGRLPVGCDRLHVGGDGAGTLTKAYKQLLVQLLMVELVDEIEERAGAGREAEAAEVERRPQPQPQPRPQPRPQPQPQPQFQPQPATTRKDAVAATERVNMTLRRWSDRRKELGLTAEQAIEVARAACDVPECWDDARRMLLVEQVVARGLDGEFDRGIGTYAVNRRNGATHQVALAAVGSPF